MRTEILVESQSRRLELLEEQALALRSVGRQLRGAQSFWGSRSGDGSSESEDDRTVIHCTQAGGDRYDVVVKEAVGIVALPDMQIIVHPKIPLEHFHALLLRSPANPRTTADRTTGAGSSLLWDLVASWFLGSLEKLLRSGLLSGYEPHHDNLAAARGSIRVYETARLYYQGSTTLSCEYDEFGHDTPLNRILRAAAAEVARQSFFGEGLRRRARRALGRLDQVGPLQDTDLVAVVDRRTARYEVALTLARHVLAATGRTAMQGTHVAETFLIRTPELVEAAVREVLRDGLSDTVTVTKRSMGLDGSTVRLNPDLVFGSTAVGDVKYKIVGGEWKRNDLYQVVAFSTGYRVRDAAVVTFALSRAGRPPALQVGDVAVRVITWDCPLDPEAAAASLVWQARTWLTNS